MAEFLQGTVQQYLDELASGAPTPGGGSAAGLAGAMGAALLCMSARFTVGRDKYASYQDAAEAVITLAEEARAELQRLMEEDAVAYAQYGAALALPKSTDEEKAARKRALQQAIRASTLAPLGIVRQAYRLLEPAATLAANCNPNLLSDVVVATQLLLAAFNSALINVRLNLRSLDDAEFVQRITEELSAMIRQAPSVAARAIETSYRGMNLPVEGVE